MIIQGDALTELKKLKPESVDCVMTSPPYWALRDYGVEGQFGLEPTFQLYIKHLCDIFDEVKRVLKKSGTCWVNIADSYCAKSYDISDKELEDSPKCDYLCENLCGGCRKAYLIGKSRNGSLPVSKQSALSSLPNHEHRESGSCHYSNLDSSQQENRNGVAKIKTRPSFRRDRAPVSVLQASKPALSSCESQKNASSLHREGKCPLCGQTSTLCVQECGHKLACTSSIEKPSGALNHRKLDKVSSDSAYPYYTIATPNVKRKSLVGIPERFVLEMQNRGWTRRQTIIWWKPNCMPSSVKDRFTCDFEYLYFFTKSEKYWFERQFERSVYPETRPSGMERHGKEYRDKVKGKYDNEKQYGGGGTSFKGYSGYIKADGTSMWSETRNKRCVWKITTKPFKEAHFAVFPEKLVETPLKAGCPKGGTALDPFCGSGTVGVVAKRQGKKFIGIELNPEYIKMAEKRIANTQGRLL